jgi:hypothetical protein
LPLGKHLSQTNENTRIADKTYLIAVVEVNHQLVDNYPYVKFAIGEIVVRNSP